MADQHAPLEYSHRRSCREGPLRVFQGQYTLRIVEVLVDVGVGLELVAFVSPHPESHTDKSILFWSSLQPTFHNVRVHHSDTNLNFKSLVDILRLRCSSDIAYAMIKGIWIAAIHTLRRENHFVFLQDKSWLKLWWRCWLDPLCKNLGLGIRYRIAAPV